MNPFDPYKNSYNRYDHYENSQRKHKRKLSMIKFWGGIIVAIIGAVWGTSAIMNNTNNVTVVVDNAAVSLNAQQVFDMYNELHLKYESLNEQKQELSIENARFRETASKYTFLLDENQKLSNEISRLQSTNVGTVPVSSYLNNAPETNSVQVWLSDLDFFARNGSGWVKWPITKMDNAGTTYENGGIYAGIVNREAHNGHSITYLVNDKYTHFIGTLVLSYDSRDATYEHLIKVYGGKENGVENLIYTSPSISGGFLARSFDIDIAGYTTIRIERIAKSGTEIGLVNTGFY